MEFDFRDISRETDSAPQISSLNGMNAGSESLSATLCPGKACPTNSGLRLGWVGLYKTPYTRYGCLEWG